jgi:ubiquinone/menaquinone biosynthesis C-methylase UbiE
MDQQPVAYVLGHSDPELQRLERQASFFATETEDILQRAGLAPGMRVLDIGCGVGDVSMIAARLVGPDGAVLGVDRSAEAVATARRRADSAGYGQARFEVADITALAPAEPFDALVGRFILLHLTDRVGLLRRLFALLRPGAAVAFVEMDIGAAASVPELPLVTRCLEWITRVYRKVGAEPDMGSHLYGTLRAAGVTPRLAGTCRMEGGPDAVAYDLVADTLRSLGPSLLSLGIATAEELGLDTLSDRLRTAAVAGEHCLILPRIVGAWARIP